ncbi:hypothetical protein [uncultured Clostridium sp.]|uniref:hypothetical protein n=1 Tax=uncultured Clostridium sp. TaxID=59620 RepID=UPI0028E3F116|nr:hypothetical protein [uncultured Clostridium sp.]
MYSVFGERENKIIHIDDITPNENGIKCNCICPSCGEKLVARTLGKKNKKCFAHLGNSNCINSIETAMHKFTKEVIENEKKIKIPRLIYNKNFKEYEIVKEQLIHFDKIEVEKYLSDFDFKPDIIIYKNEAPLIIEVAVTHKIDEEKNDKIVNSNISTIELYLDKDEIFQLSKQDLINRIINNTDNKRWIFNRFEESKKNKINNTFSSKKTLHKSPKHAESEIEELLIKYKININNLPKILSSSKNDLFTFKHYTLKFYWRLIIWDIFINKAGKNVVIPEDIISWFHNTYRSNANLSNLDKHIKNYEAVSYAIVNFIKELLSYNILILIDDTSLNPAQYIYQTNPKNLNIFRDILKKIKWIKSNDSWYGIVYKCPLSSLEEYDLRLEYIDICEKCKYFNGYVYEERKKKSIKCRG